MDYEEEVQHDKAQALQHARDALNTLSVDDLRTLKSFKNPPAQIKDVITCVLKLLVNVDPQIKTKNGKLDEFNVW